MKTRNDKGFQPVPFDRQEFFQDETFASAYQERKPIFDLRHQLIAARKKQGLTQEAIAAIMGTKKGNISRLERLDDDNLPNLRTLMRYAQAIGGHLEFRFVDDTQVETDPHS